MKRIYLLTTEHLENGLWFREEDDFRVGMNYVAIQAACCPDVFVLAFVLMSNHVHFVLQGTYDDVSDFVLLFKQRYALYYRKKYGTEGLLKRNNVDVRPIPPDDEALERAIAYVQMNCVAAGICSHPCQYPWGTGSSFFSQDSIQGLSIGHLSGRKRKRILRSFIECVPEDWLVGSNGFILPSSYVKTEFVENCYRNPNRMNYFLNTSSKAKKRIETSEKSLPGFRDQSILAVLPDLYRSLFQKDSFQNLLPEQKIEMVKQIRFRFSADATQIARVCGITYAQAAQLLDNA